MKSKIYKLMGVALVVVLLASLTVGLSAPAAADPGKLKFTKLDLPQVEDWGTPGSEGDYWCTPGADVGRIATSPDGDLFATIGGNSFMNFVDPLYTFAEGTGEVSFTTAEAHTSGYSVKLVNVAGAADWAQVAIPVDIALEDITSLSFWHKESTVTAFGTISIQLYIDYDGDGDFDKDATDWYLTRDPNPAGGSLTWAQEDATAGSWWWLRDGANNVQATTNIPAWTSTTLADFQDEPELVGKRVTHVVLGFGGSTLFSNVTAYVDDPSVNGSTFDLEGADLMKSTDGGYSWEMLGSFGPVVDIVTSPEYEEDETMFVATQSLVYQSVDGGDTFAAMAAPWGANNEVINDLDVTIDDKDRITVMVGTSGAGFSGDVYIYGSKTLAWTAQGIIGYYGLPVDVLACGFSPFFDGDEVFAAVVTNPIATHVRFAITPTTTAAPAAWGATYGDAPIRDAVDNNFESTFASIAFPDDFDAGGLGTNTLFVGIYAGDTGVQYDPAAVPNCELGDVYKIGIFGAPFFSSADDLDIRGEASTLQPTATNIASIDVAGNAADCNVIVGTDYMNVFSIPAYGMLYHSEDGGDTWTFCFKAPTGGAMFATGAMVQVLASHDYLDSGIAYAGTMGVGNSGFSRSPGDFSTTFNQISLIDYGDPDNGYGLAWLDATGYNTDDELHMVTQVGGTVGALWQTTNGGENWERIYSYGNTGENDMEQVWRVGESTIFTIDYTNNSIWRSSDMGKTWFKKITPKAVTGENWCATSFVSETELWAGYDGGSVLWSTNSGGTWDKPEENPISTPIMAILPMGPNVLISAIGGVYFSSDSGETIDQVGDPNEPVGPGAMCFATSDFDFANNNMIYCVSFMGTPGDGIWRAEVNFDDPGESEWVQIDDGAGAYNPNTVWATSMPVGFLPPSGVLYVVDGFPVDLGPAEFDLDGGLWRCANPTADVDSPNYPVFEKENKGLDPNDMIALLSFDVFPMTIFCINMNPANYWEQLVVFTDVLDTGPPLVTPADDATGVGLLPAGEVYPNVVFAWEEMAGATRYELQVAVDPDFKSRVEDWFITSLTFEVTRMSPNTTYYWRVRVAEQDANGDLIGAPLISPWSPTYSFKTAIGASMARPDLEAPWPGEPDVALSPTFEWSGIEWATYYEFELALDPTTTTGGYFADPLVALIGTNALVSTAWKCDITLNYDGRYYWHVKAIGEDTETPWSDVGTFTTMGVPPEPPEPVEPVVIPPAEQITPAWIWAIVIIGAILVIAVIVLIVTTRRVP